MLDIHTENRIVGSCWNTVRKDLKTIVESKGGDIKTCGIRFWDRPISLDEDTGQWAEKGMHSKPSRWLFTFEEGDSQLAPADRMAYFSLRNEALAFVVRAVPTFYNSDRDAFNFSENLEWVVVFIAKSLTPRGSSSATAHTSRLDEGILTITTDDREFEVPLECVGVIKPEDKLSSALFQNVDDKFEEFLSQSVDCYVLNDHQKRESFLQRIDQLQMRSNAEALSQENSWITDHDLQTVETIFEDGQSSLMLWGDDYSTITATIDHLESLTAYDFAHYEALPTWDEHSLSRLVDDENLGNKIVCVHGSERLDPELVLPAILSRPSNIELKAADGNEVTEANQKPRCWIFTGHHLEHSQIRRWHRVAHHHLKWFRCEATVPPTEAVQRIYQEEGIQTSSTNWFDNLFVIMWEELIAYLPVSPELLATIVRKTLRQDPSGTWDLDATPIQKGIIVREIESRLSPMIASLASESRKQCVNSLISTLEIPQAQGQKLIFLTRIL